ncbi:hypothetical protein D9M68_703340 [compost metagenome]
MYIALNGKNRGAQLMRQVAQKFFPELLIYFQQLYFGTLFLRPFGYIIFYLFYSLLR